VRGRALALARLLVAAEILAAVRLGALGEWWAARALRRLRALERLERRRGR
jgi:hypothetical protein